MTIVLAPAAAAINLSPLARTAGAIAAGANNSARRDALRRSLDEAGLPYVLESFPVDHARPGVNVVVTLPGWSADTILVSAHYDRFSRGSGAVDNAASCAVLIELARTFATTVRRSTLQFVFFDLEEDQRQGSQAYVNRHDKALPRRAVNLDVFAYGTVLFGTVDPPDGSLSRALVAAARSERVPLHLRPPDEYPSSDHRTLMSAGIETAGLALLTPEDVELLSDPSAAPKSRVASIIHSPSDTVDEIHFDEITAAIPVLERFIGLLAAPHLLGTPRAARD